MSVRETVIVASVSKGSHISRADKAAVSDKFSELVSDSALRRELSSKRDDNMPTDSGVSKLALAKQSDIKVKAENSKPSDDKRVQQAHESAESNKPREDASVSEAQNAVEETSTSCDPETAIVDTEELSWIEEIGELILGEEVDSKLALKVASGDDNYASLEFADEEITQPAGATYTTVIAKKIPTMAVESDLAGAGEVAMLVTPDAGVDSETAPIVAAPILLDSDAIDIEEAVDDAVELIAQLVAHDAAEIVSEEHVVDDQVNIEQATSAEPQLRQEVVQAAIAAPVTLALATQKTVVGGNKQQEEIVVRPSSEEDTEARRVDDMVPAVSVIEKGEADEGQYQSNARDNKFAHQPAIAANKTVLPTETLASQGEKFTTELQKLAEPTNNTVVLHSATMLASGDRVYEFAINPSEISPDIHTVSEQVQIAVKAATTEGHNNFIMRLAPESLGVIEVQMEVVGNKVTSIKMLVERPETLQVLAREAELLLRDVGRVIDVESATLSLDLRSNSDQSQNPNQGQSNMASTISADDSNGSAVGNKVYDKTTERAAKAASNGGVDMTV